MAARMAAQGVSWVAQDDRAAQLAQRQVRAGQLPGAPLLLGAQNQEPLGSLDDVDPKLLETYQKLGIPLTEQKLLAGVAVDAIFDSVSVGTTYKAKLAEAGVIFCSFGEAVREHPGAGPEIPGLGGSGQRQLLRGPERRGVQ